MTTDSLKDIEEKLLDKQVVSILGDIDQEMANSIIKQLYYYLIPDDPSCTCRPKNGRISFIINSPGGDVYAMLAIYDLMQSLQKQGYVVETIAVGYAMSAAAVLLAAGSPKARYAYANTRIMIHQVSAEARYASIQDLNLDVEETNLLNDNIFAILKRHTKLSLKVLQKEMNRDCFMDANNAIKFNLIDSIVGSK